MRVFIVGAGIGGLSLALSLHAAGIDAEVYEAVGELKPLGVGINLLPHAARELIELGLGEDLARIGIATQALIYTNKFGQEIWREARGLGAGYNWPQYSIHRGALQMLLLEAVKARLGEDRVHLGLTAARAQTTPGGALVELQERRGGSRISASGDVVVACDGVHSALRAHLRPDEGPPIWNRRVLWRGVTEAAPYLGGETMVMAGHQDIKFVCYPIDPDSRSRGHSRINWIAELSFPGAPEWRRDDWNRAGDIDDFLPAFESWDFGWLDVPGLIRGAEQIFEYPMVDRDPLERWTDGRLTLLGDAAHPMYPIGSNGASQAIIDARTLAFHLATESDIDAGLASYEAARRPPTSAIVMANRGNGPEQVMQMAEERAPSGFDRIEDVINRAELESVVDGYKRLAGFDPALLNARVSLSARL